MKQHIYAPVSIHDADVKEVTINTNRYKLMLWRADLKFISYINGDVLKKMDTLQYLVLVLYPI